MSTEPLVRTDRFDRLTLAHDASHYLLIPEAVATPRNVDELSALIRRARRDGTGLTFRSGGTSLSGQAVTSGLLADTRRHFGAIEVLDDGARVRVQPGAVVRQVNARLAPHHTKLGPDPASDGACTLGGVLANNSSGMLCGTEYNSYQTLESLVLVLPSGTVIDTGTADADEKLRLTEPDLYAGLVTLRDRIRGNPDSVATIRRQFSMKNTMGYGLNSFLDHDSATEILAHLMIGSEGTLGFIAEATLRTVPVHPHVGTGLLVFDSLSAAMAALPDLVDTGLATVELLDAQSLRVAQALRNSPEAIRRLEVQRHAALLVEHHAPSSDELTERLRTTERVTAELPLFGPAAMSTEASTRGSLWTVRKGLYAAVAEARPQGTTAMLEDVVVPVGALLEACESLTELFDRYAYPESVIFGHAKDGNVHFLLNEEFGSDVQRYTDFTEDMVQLILGLGGSLKAEHGTGRIMAPFVRRQYGDELTEVMIAVKRLCDPDGVLNPGVLLNDDESAHISNLKTTLPVEDEVDRCVECGFCEPVCPSRTLTLTPRQRIVARRELAAARQRGDSELVNEITERYEYAGNQTCAADGMCSTACPVGIDTGDLARRLRGTQTGTAEQGVWDAAARAWGPFTAAGSLALTAAAAVPGATAASELGRALLGTEVVPRYDHGLPAGGPPRQGWRSEQAEVVWFDACIQTMFGPEPGQQPLARAVEELFRRAGVVVRTPAGLQGLCCGTPWSSKGKHTGHATMAERTVPALVEASEQGRLPIVCDAASCTEGLLKSAKDSQPTLQILDLVAYARAELLPRLTVRRKVESVVLHPTCSSRQLGLDADLQAIAGAVAEEVVVPTSWGCCGFAGDRGLLHPELTAAATEAEAAEVAQREFSAYASLNRTCEIGMTRATGRPYQHILQLLAECTR
ncbi:FAD-binding oxidoreductase [Enemella dayhoffiae]|uniref:D-lactate dehydrogenase (cytochrome) n=1 Tax=Enemella dayhoffiae TaxID=2016507 RepID=A0A255H0D8_9ACTN|nr:FAD-binding and (Fe-S)-binding domain-containing protein [Enemella dayhoffiae]OYO20776.1 FAD-binding oxidoreductase [Enemella dayhoffiae]